MQTPVAKLALCCIHHPVGEGRRPPASRRRTTCISLTAPIHFMDQQDTQQQATTQVLFPMRCFCTPPMGSTSMSSAPASRSTCAIYGVLKLLVCYAHTQFLLQVAALLQAGWYDVAAHTDATIEQNEFVCFLHGRIRYPTCKDPNTSQKLQGQRKCHKACNRIWILIHAYQHATLRHMRQVPAYTDTKANHGRGASGGYTGQAKQQDTMDAATLGSTQLKKT